MKSWKPLVAALAFGLLASLPARAAVFSVTDGIAGTTPQVKTYVFELLEAGDYVASLIDLQFPSSFDFMAAAVSHTGGAIVGSTPQAGTFSLPDLVAGSYTVLFVGTPGASGAGFFSFSVVPEPAMWLMMGVGAMLIAFVKLRAGEHL